MTSPSLIHGWLAVSLSLALALSGCCGTSPTDEDGTGDPRVDPALNGAWVDGVQSGLTYVYITELRFDNALRSSITTGLHSVSWAATADRILSLEIH
jgi:hypothetical protein